MEEVRAQVRRVFIHAFSHLLDVSSDPYLRTKPLVKYH